MKYLSLILVLLSVRAGAQTCAPAGKEMAQYFAQAAWRSHTVTGESVKPVQGLIDDEGNFRFGNLSRGGTLKVELGLDKYNRDFFRYCREGNAPFLAVMRRKEKNVYKVSARYLPSFSGFANSPFAVVNWRPWGAQKLEFTFAEGAVADSYGYGAKPRTDFVKAMNQQIAAQKDYGSIELDLTGFDDLVCDLVQGRVGMVYRGQGISDAPAIVQRQEIDPNDVRTAYLALREPLRNSASKESGLFLAGRVLGRLEQERRISPLGDVKSFELYKKLASADLARLNELGDAGLQCAADQLQTYVRETENHIFNFKLVTDNLDALEAAVSEQK